MANALCALRKKAYLKKPLLFFSYFIKGKPSQYIVSPKYDVKSSQKYLLPSSLGWTRMR